MSLSCAASSSSPVLVLLVVKERVVGGQERGSQSHLFGSECFGEVRHGSRVDATGHDAVDGDVLLSLQDRPHCFGPLVRCCLRCAVFRERLTGVDSNQDASDNCLPSLPLRIMAHEVYGQCSPVYRSFQVNVSAGSVGLSRQVVNCCIAASKVVH